MEISEAKTIANCQKGELEGFGVLYDIYIKKIYDFIYFKVSDKEIAQDLTSQTFFKALDNINKFDISKGKFSSWIYKIARNLIIDYYRSYKSEDSIENYQSIENISNLDDLIDNKDKLEKVEQYLNKLKPENKEIVMMRLWDGLSYSEISEILEKTEASCKMMFSRTIGKLREDLSLIIIYILLFLIHNYG